MFANRGCLAPPPPILVFCRQERIAVGQIRQTMETKIQPRARLFVAKHQATKMGAPRPAAMETSQLGPEEKSWIRCHSAQAPAGAPFRDLRICLELSSADRRRGGESAFRPGLIGHRRSENRRGAGCRSKRRRTRAGRERGFPRRRADLEFFRGDRHFLALLVERAEEDALHEPQHVPGAQNDAEDAQDGNRFH